MTIKKESLIELNRPDGIVTFMAKQRILEAAVFLAEEEGAQALTLEKVAERAGVSKGGLLYHFRSKEALLAGMLESVISEHEEMLDARVAEGVPSYQAMIDMALSKSVNHHNLITAFFTALAADPQMSQSILEHKVAWHERLVQDGLEADQRTVLELVLDGLYAGTSLGITEITDEKAHLLRQGLHRVLRPKTDTLLARMFQEILPLAEASVPLVAE